MSTAAGADAGSSAPKAHAGAITHSRIRNFLIDDTLPLVVMSRRRYARARLLRNRTSVSARAGTPRNAERERIAAGLDHDALAGRVAGEQLEHGAGDGLGRDDRDAARGDQRRGSAR